MCLSGGSLPERFAIQKIWQDRVEDLIELKQKAELEYVYKSNFRHQEKISTVLRFTIKYILGIATVQFNRRMPVEGDSSLQVILRLEQLILCDEFSHHQEAVKTRKKNSDHPYGLCVKFFPCVSL